MKIRSLKFLGAFVALLLLCVTNLAQAANPFFPRDVGRDNFMLAAAIEACAHDPKWKACELDRRTTIEAYASQWGKTPQQLADDLRNATVVACTDTIRTSGVDEKGRFTQWTRSCRPGEMIAVLPDGQEVALECGNWKESERKAEVPASTSPAISVVRRPDCEDGPPVTFQSGGSEDIFGGISAGSSFAGMGIGGTTFNGVVFNGCNQ
jgi:hypothetical protein